MPTHNGEGRGRGGRVPPPADGGAPPEARLRRVPRQDGPPGIRLRELRRRGRVAGEGREVPDRPVRRPPRRLQLPRRRRAEEDAPLEEGRVLPLPCGEDLDLCPGPRA